MEPMGRDLEFAEHLLLALERFSYNESCLGFSILGFRASIQSYGAKLKASRFELVLE